LRPQRATLAWRAQRTTDPPIFGAIILLRHEVRVP